MDVKKTISVSTLAAGLALGQVAAAAADKPAEETQKIEQSLLEKLKDAAAVDVEDYVARTEDCFDCIG